MEYTKNRVLRTLYQNIDLILFGGSILLVGLLPYSVISMALVFVTGFNHSIPIAHLIFGYLALFMQLSFVIVSVVVLIQSVKTQKSIIFYLLCVIISLLYILYAVYAGYGLAGGIA